MEKMKHKEVIKIVKRNEAQELVKTVTEYASKNTEAIIVAAVAVLVVSIGIPLYLNSRSANEVKAQQILAKGNYFLTRPVLDQKDAQMYGMFRTKEEKYDKAIMAYNEIVQTYGGSKSLPYALLGIANAYYNLGKYKDSIDGYNTFLEKYPKHLLAPEAYAGRAYANFEQGLYKPALDDLNYAMDNYKDSYNMNDMKFRAAECHYKLNDAASAKQAYEQIISGAKDSYWAGVAKEKLKEVK